MLVEMKRHIGYFSREFIGACCRPNTIPNPTIPSLYRSDDVRDNTIFFSECERDSKFIDPMGYHMVGCNIDAHAIRLHSAVAYNLTPLFRFLGSALELEPLNLLPATRKIIVDQTLRFRIHLVKVVRLF